MTSKPVTSLTKSQEKMLRSQDLDRGKEDQRQETEEGQGGWGDWIHDLDQFLSPQIMQ